MFESIEENSFDHFLNLQDLYFNITNLKSFPSSLIENLKRLKTLYIFYKDIPDKDIEILVNRFPNLDITLHKKD